MRYNAGKKRSSSRGWLRRNAKRAYGFAKKRYHVGGKWDINKIKQDANQALSIAKTAYGLLNTEKKRYEFTYYNNAIGQVNGNTTGYYYQDITPLPNEGSGYGNRNGSSISLRSYFIHMQVNHMSATTQPIKITFYVIQTKTADDFYMPTFMQPNKYILAQNSTSIYDTHCQRNPDYFATYKILKTKSVYLQTDAYSGVPIGKDVNIKLNFGKNGKHIRFKGDLNQNTNERIWLVAVASNGNCSTTTNSGLNSLLVTGMNTGVYMHLDGIAYFIDN